MPGGFFFLPFTAAFYARGRMKGEGSRRFSGESAAALGLASARSVLLLIARGSCRYHRHRMLHATRHRAGAV
jgi:hypothetical protein